MELRRAPAWNVGAYTRARRASGDLVSTAARERFLVRAHPVVEADVAVGTARDDRN